MEEIDDMRMREVEAFLSFVSGAETDRAIAARSFHILAEFLPEDFKRVSRLFTDANANAGFAFLGRDADTEAPIIEDINESGHEIVLHGHRHVMFDELSYETAHNDLATGMNAIEDATGLSPTGFFAPFKAVSEGTLRAAADLDLGWVLGKTTADVPDSVTMVDSVYPHDSRLLEGGTSPNETFHELNETVADGQTFLFHPNLLEYYSAMDEFAEWIAANEPVSVGEQLDGGDGPGVVLDCLRPIPVE